MISRRSLFWLLLVLSPFVLAACSSTSGTLGQIHEGRILMLTVIEINRTDELRYSTIDPSDVIRRWRMQPSKEGLELLLMRLVGAPVSGPHATPVNEQQTNRM